MRTAPCILVPPKNENEEKKKKEEKWSYDKMLIDW